MVDYKCFGKMRASKRAWEAHRGDGSVWDCKFKWDKQGRPN